MCLSNKVKAGETQKTKQIHNLDFRKSTTLLLLWYNTQTGSPDAKFADFNKGT